tara:strand:+ start:369 stop:2330 length:1962 start_codon:yes stop_codon:yes gene_type:complete
MRDLAYYSSKKASPKENIFLSKRSFLKKINHVDQIWEYLKNNYGKIMAVNDLRGQNNEEYNYHELEKLISKASMAFFKLGLRKGEVVSVIAENSPRWLIADQAIMRLGAVDAVRGCSAPSIELEYIIQHSNSVGLVIQSREIWLKLSNRDELINKLKFIIILDDISFEKLIGWDSFIHIANQSNSPNDYLDYKLELSKAHIHDVATILYTSGTTGKPKGVPLTHENLLHQITNLACIADPQPATPVLSVLPIWHSYERSAEYFFFSCGCSQFYTSPKYLKDDIKIVQPVVMATVPRLWEAIYDGFFSALKKMPRNKQRLIKFLITNSSFFKKDLRKILNKDMIPVTSNQKLSGFLSLFLRFLPHVLSTFFIYPGILKQLCGQNLKFPINGGGALPDHVDLFFESLGINVLVGYGLTETSPVLTCRRTWENVRGSSGQPLPFTEVKILNETKDKILNFHQIGKIFVRGPQVMKGYLNNISATKEVLSNDGWFDTGDLGFLIPGGSLVITGRAKDTIVLSSGENIEPSPLETEILSSDYINQVQLVGQDKKNLSALIVPNMEFIYRKISSNVLSEINQNTEIRKIYKYEINRLLKNRIASRVEEQISDCFFVNPFTIENGLMTQTLKQKRKEIEELYKKEIEEMYKKQIKRGNLI